MREHPICGMKTTQSVKEDEIKIFRTIFDELDRYEDFLIKTEVYLKALRGDLRVEKLLDKPAIRIPVVNRELTVQDILAQIDTDVKSAIDSGVNTMQYISWNQFIDYFKNYKTSKFTRQHPEVEEQEAPKLLLSETQMQIIQDVFDMLPRAAEDYVDKIEFVKAAKRDPQVHSFWKQKVENEDEEDEDKQITVGELFDKILLSDLNYLKWEDVVPFFSQNQGNRNVSQGEEGEMEDFQGQTLKSEFPTFAPDHISEAAKEDDDESLPADEGSPMKKMKGKSQHQQERKNARGQKAKERDPKAYDELDAELRKEYEQLQVDLRAYGVAQKNMKNEKGLTIPKPFRFQNSKPQEEAKVPIRQAKVQKMVEEKVKEEEDALNFKFKANPLPAYVKVPMYNALVKAHEEKRMDVVEKSKQITLANQKPFSFAERDANKEKPVAKEESFQQFKANPVPQFVQVEMMKEKEEKERKEREERIKKRMEDNAMSSKMPSRMEAAEKAKSEGTVKKYVNPKKYQPEEFSHKPNINRDVPDYDQLNQEFNEKLQKKKKDVPKTQAKPFSFQGAITEMVTKMVETEGMKRRDSSSKQAPQIKKKQSAPAKQQKPKRKPTEEQEQEEQQEEEVQNNDENNEEEEYPADQEEAQEEGGEENNEYREEGGDEDMFQVENEEGGDQSVNPMALKKQATKPNSKKAKEEEVQEEEEKVSVRSEANKTLSQTGRSTQGGTQKKGPILTKKLEQEFEKRKKEKEARDKRFEDMKKEEQERTQKKKDFAPKVKSAYNTVNKVDKREEENAQRIRDAKDRMKQEQTDYNERIKEMKNKVNTAPLMIEKRTYGSRLLDRYRNAINKGWSTLEGPEDEQENTVHSTGGKIKRQPTTSENYDNEEQQVDEDNEEQQVDEDNEEKPEEQAEEAEEKAEEAENNEEAENENNNEEEPENNNNEEEENNNNNGEEENNDNEGDKNNEDENKDNEEKEEEKVDKNAEEEDEYKDDEFENNDE